jgi:hypothetical protein
MPCNKADIQVFIDQAVEKFLSGEYNPVEYAPYLKAMEDIIKGIRENQDVKDFMIYELEKTGGKMNGVSIVPVTRYDYSGDLVWSQLDAKIKELTEQSKYREKLLKPITVAEFPDPVHEGVIIKPPQKTTSKTIRVTLK